MINLTLKHSVTILLNFLCIIYATSQNLPDCCPAVYYYQKTEIIPEYTFAQKIICGENVIPLNFAPKGIVSIPTGSSPKVFVATEFMEFQPGNELPLGSYTVTYFCDENFAKANHPPINIITLPNVFSPNGDGQNDNFVVNINSATYFYAEIQQRKNGNFSKIFEAYGDIYANYLKIWDGNQGVDFSVGNDTTTFLYRIQFSNCKYAESFFHVDYVTVFR